MPLNLKPDALAKEDLSVLAELDARGLLVAPGETLATYADRLHRLDAALNGIDRDLDTDGIHYLYSDFPLRSETRIPPEIMAEAGDATARRYGFKMDWAPGFFLSQSLGLLWGGCALSFPETGLAVFIVRAAFAKRDRWLIYGRAELLAHELCHAARLPLNDRAHEEWFAYRLSPSALRRYLGNCFQTDLDTYLFLLPVLLLLTAQTVQVFGLLPQLPVWPFWLLAAATPIYLFVRNHLAHGRLQSALRALAAAGAANPEAVLFRCTDAEICALANFATDSAGLPAWLEQRATAELRWRVIRHRFMTTKIEDK